MVQTSFKTKFFNIFRYPFTLPVLERLPLFFAKRARPESYIFKFIPNNYQYRSLTRRKVERNGIAYELDLSDFIQCAVFWNNIDRPLLKLFSLCKQGFTILDVGANIGHVALNMAQKVGKNGKVFTFEPEPRNFRSLQKNIALNPWATDRIVAVNEGMGSSPGVFTMYLVNKLNRGGNRILLNQNGQEHTEKVEIRVAVIDQFIREQKITRVDLLKIDVEGFEYEVLKGAEETLKAYKPTLFVELSENNLKQNGASSKMVIELLENLNYTIEEAEKGNRVSSQDSFRDRHFDIIAY